MDSLAAGLHAITTSTCKILLFGHTKFICEIKVVPAFLLFHHGRRVGKPHCQKTAVYRASEHKTPPSQFLFGPSPQTERTRQGSSVKGFSLATLCPHKHVALSIFPDFRSSGQVLGLGSHVGAGVDALLGELTAMLLVCMAKLPNVVRDLRKGNLEALLNLLEHLLCQL